MREGWFWAFELPDTHYVGALAGIALGPEAFNDPAGTLSKHLTYSFDARDGLSGIQDLVGGEVGTIVQDAAGRMTHYEFDGVVQDMVWDAADRMVSITHNGQTSFYSYDWRNWRTEKVKPLETVKYTWGADDLVAEEATVIGESGPRLIRTYLQGPTMGVVLGTVDSGGTTLFAHDALGSVVGRVGPVGSVGLQRFDAWGTMSGAAGFRVPGVGDNEVAFTGHHRDVETGLTYGKARYFQNEVGRWISSDPVRDAFVQGPMGSNAWQYARWNPLRYVDVLGLYVVEPPEKEIVYVAGDIEGRQGAKRPGVTEVTVRPQGVCGGANCSLQFRIRVKITTKIKERDHFYKKCPRSVVLQHELMHVKRYERFYFETDFVELRSAEHDYPSMSACEAARSQALQAFFRRLDVADASEKFWMDILGYAGSKDGCRLYQENFNGPPWLPESGSDL